MQPRRLALAADGRPLLSWRVALLPSLGRKDLFERFGPEEAWDSPRNRPLVDAMPDVFGPPGEGPSSTRFRVFVGPETAFLVAAKGLPGKAIRDGTINTLLVVEAAEAVTWTKPDDLTAPAGRPLPKLGRAGSGWASLMLANGGVVTFRITPEAEPILRALITRDGGEKPDSKQLPR